MQQQYAVLIGIQPDLSQRRAQLSGRRLGVVSLDDPADAAQQVEDEEIRDHRAVGEAPPLDPGHRAGEMLAELGKEAGFADAGLSDDADEPAMTLLDRRYHAVQHGDLAHATDKRP